MSIIAIWDLLDDRYLNHADLAAISGGHWESSGVGEATPRLYSEIAYELPTAENVLEQVGGLAPGRVHLGGRGDGEIDGSRYPWCRH